MIEANNTPEALQGVLPPENLTIEADDFSGHQDAHALPAPRALTADDQDAIKEHLENIIEAAAAAGADTVPAQYRDQYERDFKSSRIVRAAVSATGIAPALHELLPTNGTEAAGPIKQLHPVARVALGVLVLGLATFVQRRTILNAHNANSFSAGGGAPAGINTAQQTGYFQHSPGGE